MKITAGNEKRCEILFRFQQADIYFDWLTNKPLNKFRNLYDQIYVLSIVYNSIFTALKKTIFLCILVFGVVYIQCLFVAPVLRDYFWWVFGGLIESRFKPGLALCKISVLLTVLSLVPKT